MHDQVKASLFYFLFSAAGTILDATGRELRGGHRRAAWREGHVADGVNI